MASGSASAKGNPASHRMSNPRLKEKFARCWRNGQKRKAERQARALAAQRRNAELRESGELTPWEQAKAARKARRNG